MFVFILPSFFYLGVDSVGGIMVAGALVGQDLEVSGRGSVDVLFPE